MVTTVRDLWVVAAFQEVIANAFSRASITNSETFPFTAEALAVVLYFKWVVDRNEVGAVNNLWALEFFVANLLRPSNCFRKMVRRMMLYHY